MCQVQGHVYSLDPSYTLRNGFTLYPVGAPPFPFLLMGRENQNENSCAQMLCLGLQNILVFHSSCCFYKIKSNILIIKYGMCIYLCFLPAFKGFKEA